VRFITLTLAALLGYSAASPADQPHAPGIAIEEPSSARFASEAEVAMKAVVQILNEFDCSGARQDGRVTIRRLNRVEYNNTIRDLIGVDFKPSADFPNDDVGHGFDNIGDVLSVTPLLLEKYLAENEGERFEDWVRLALEGVLIWPDFLFRVELDPPGLAPGTATAAGTPTLLGRGRSPACPAFDLGFFTLHRGT
jgi:hypothetical protein